MISFIGNEKHKVLHSDVDTVRTVMHLSRDLSHTAGDLNLEIIRLLIMSTPKQAA